MFFSKVFLLTTALVPVSFALVSSPTGYRQMGQTLVNEDAVKFGDVVELSDDGKQMAVASTTGISVFSLDQTTADEDSISQSTWQAVMKVPVNGNTGGLSLSGDGMLLAARQQEAVKVYYVPYGFSTTITNACTGGQSLHLGQTQSSSVFGAQSWLLVGCDRHDDKRGMVEIYVMDNDVWHPYTTIHGQQSGARFGFATGFAVHNNVPMIAISSPDYNDGQGLVQVFALPSQGGYQQQGSDITGEALGDKFGFAMDFRSSTGVPQLVVGAPQCRDNLGCVSVYDLSHTNLRPTQNWQQMGEVMTGEEQGERFGRSVAISKTGNRIAASSVHYQRLTGIVRVYEHDDENLELVGAFQGGVPGKQWGKSVALNGPGSMVVSAAVLSNSVQVFLDHSPFCGLPIGGYSNAQMFLERPICKDNNGSIAKTEIECANTSCQWIDTLATATPSVVPTYSPTVSVMPSTLPSYSPSVVPSATPSSSSSPSSGPSAFPSVTPSDTPSDFPSAVPSQVPSDFPSQFPSASPSWSPSWAPSSAPSRSLAPSQAPSSKPSMNGPSSDSADSGGINIIGLVVAMVIVGFVFSAVVKKFRKEKNEEGKATDESQPSEVAVESA